MRGKSWEELWESSWTVLWRLLPLLAIVFSSGISGAWFNEQFRTELLWLRWGWLGAWIAGIAVFGGVRMVATDKKDIRGWLIIVAGGVTEVLLSAQYFGADHDWLTAIVLGIYPTGVAILAGFGEAAIQAQRANKEEERDQLMWEREQAEKDAERRAAERLRKMELNAQITANVQIARVQAEINSANVHELPQLPQPSANSSANHSRSPLNAEELSALSAIRSVVNFGVFASSEAVEFSPWSKTKTYELLAVAEEAGLVAKIGHGKWQFRMDEVS